jgi:hypothetical protein
MCQHLSYKNNKNKNNKLIQWFKIVHLTINYVSRDCVHNQYNHGGLVVSVFCDCNLKKTINGKNDEFTMIV